MKKTILLTPVIAIAIVSMLFSCVDSEKDLYDPSYQTSNPMGDGFAAPDGFNWATTSNVKVNVEVNAQTDDEFYYVVEIYDTNPIISPNAHLLDKGVAKGNEPYKSLQRDLLLSEQQRLQMELPTAISKQLHLLCGVLLLRLAVLPQ